MKKLIAFTMVALFAGSLIAQNATQAKAEGKTAPRVAQDNGQGKDEGKHIGEEKEHHRHHRHHHHREHKENK